MNCIDCMDKDCVDCIIEDVIVDIRNIKWEVRSRLNESCYSCSIEVEKNIDCVECIKLLIVKMMSDKLRRFV